TAARAETAEAHARVEARDRSIAELLASTSWRLTAPMRFVGDRLRGKSRRRMIDLEQIRRHRLETNPYRWAAIGDLFRPGDAERLAATYPCDHFKLVAAYDGE